MKLKMTVAQLVTGAGALVAALFSFFDFYSFGDEGRSSWSQDTGAYVTTIPSILAIVMLAWTIAELAGAKLPAHVLTFSPAQLKTTWGVSAAGIMLAFLTVDTLADRGIGFWMQLVGSLAMAIGAVMALLGKGGQEVKFGGNAAAPGAPKPPASPMAPPPGMAPPPPPPGATPPPPPPPPAG